MIDLNEYLLKPLTPVVLVGLECELYGADNNIIVVGVKSSRWGIEVLDDPDDGYRSMLGELRVLSRTELQQREVMYARTYSKSLARVKFEEGDPHPHNEVGEVDEVYVLRDVADGHVWLCFGTVSVDDYYPVFVFEWTPKEKK